MPNNVHEPVKELEMEGERVSFLIHTTPIYSTPPHLTPLHPNLYPPYHCPTFLNVSNRSGDHYPDDENKMLAFFIEVVNYFVLVHVEQSLKDFVGWDILEKA